MALRLRRGTQAERDDAGFIPDSGEPVWTIDTKRLYVGDGTTPGGNLITASGGGSITGITDTTTGSVLALSDLAATFSVDIEMDAAADITLSATSQLNGAGQISLTGDITGGNFSGNAATFTSVTSIGGLAGDLTGSVFADDSTLLIDGVNGKITGTISTTGIEASSGALEVTRPSTGLTELTVYGNEERGSLKVTRESASDLSASDVTLGRLVFERDDVSGPLSIASITANRNHLYFASTSTGDFLTDANYFVWTEGKMGIGKTTGVTAALDVVGDAVISGSLTAGSVAVTGNIIDTTDSSNITVAQATTFTSDVTVENNLVVTNTLACDTLEVTNFTTSGAGTPELTSDTAILLTAGTRVEVTQSPFKLAPYTDAQRGALTPENGDMIYNTDNHRVEVYANGGWYSLDMTPVV